MEFRVAPAPRPSSADDEERRITQVLEIERQLVLETQENYKLLKEKFLDVTEQLALANKEVEILRAEKEAEEKTRKELSKLDERSKEVLHRMELDNKKRQLAQHHFQTGTLAELQKVFQKEIADQEMEIKKLEEEKDGLVEENDRLLEEIRQLQLEITKTKKVFKERERGLADDFDLQLQEMMSSIENERRDQEEPPVVFSLKERIKMIENMLETKEKERREEREDMEERIRKLSEKLVEEREKNQRLAAYQSQVEMTKLEVKKIVQEKNIQLDELRRQIIDLQKQKITENSTSSERERRLQNDLFEQSFSIDKKLIEMEQTIKERDSYIEELKQKLDETKLDESGIEKLEHNYHAEKESRERVERENKRLSELVERKDLECTQQIASLKLERNRLEESIADIKNRLKTTPETVEEVLKLRAHLARKEEQEKALKEHYRGLLSRMKKSLKNIEKRHRHTQKTLEEHILI